LENINEDILGNVNIMEKTTSSPTSNGSLKRSTSICYDSDDEKDSLLRKKNPSINSS
jgi:hypothetical protein